MISEEKEEIFISMFLYFERNSIIVAVCEFLTGRIDAFRFTENFGAVIFDSSKKDKFISLLENPETRKIVFRETEGPLEDGRAEFFKMLVENTEDLVSDFIDILGEKIENDKSLEDIDISIGIPDEVKEMSEKMKIQLDEIWSIDLEELGAVEDLRDSVRRRAHAYELLSLSSPPSCVSPDVDNTSKTPSPTSNTETSKVLPLRSR